MSKEEEQTNTIEMEQPKNPPPVKLYFAPGSPYCRRVQIMLDEKHIEYQPMPISLSTNENKSEFFLSLNPRGKVPTLVDGDIILYESMAILLYLDERYEETPLIPTDFTLKARVYVRMMETQYLSDALLLFRPFFMGCKCVVKNKTDYDNAIENLLNEYKRWDSYLRDSTFVVGNNFSAADACLIPFIALGVHLGFVFKDIKELQNLSRYWDLVNERPSVKKSERKLNCFKKKFCWGKHNKEQDC